MEEKIGVIIWAAIGAAFLAYRIFITVLVARNACRRGGNRVAWSIGTFFLGFLVVIPYLLVSKDTSKAETREPSR